MAGPYLDVNEAAAKLRISVGYVRQLVSEGRIEAKRLSPNGKLLFDSSALDAALRPAHEPPKKAR